MPETSEELVLKRVSDEINFTTEMAMVLFHSAPDAIVVVDANGLIRMVNTQAELLFGYHHTEMRNRKVEMLMPEAVRSIHEEHRIRFLDDPRTRPMGLHLQLKARRKSGDLVSVDINLAPVVTAKGTFVISTIRRRRPDDALRLGDNAATG